MTITVPRAKTAVRTNHPERASRARQRQRLIDACIAALHIHGPSHTTVEKVVALADMSPGIVRFYFESKDAMLLASLAYLANEFEQRVMLPVLALKETPVAALQKLVELYLDAEIASPRKVSVWYCFWGEASSRQEYLEICGKKDDDFAALVLDLVQRMIAHSAATHLDADAVALGLIGVLEVLWQNIAFTAESAIDRPHARARALAYLRSVFPGTFAALPSSRGSRMALSLYVDEALLSIERERLFRPSWQFAGHESDIPRPGDFLTVDLAAERALVLRDESGSVRAFRNTCRRMPHALVSGARGRLRSIECPIHGLTYDLEGRWVAGSVAGDLTSLEQLQAGHFVLVRPPGSAGPEPALNLGAQVSLAATGSQEWRVAANWKLLIEQWLDEPLLCAGLQRTFVGPNQLLELSEARALILQVIPDTPGSCRIRRLEYVAPGTPRRTGPGRTDRRRTGNRAASRRSDPDGWLQQCIEVAESTQKGLASGAFETPAATAVSGPLAEFRRTIQDLLPVAEASRFGR